MQQAQHEFAAAADVYQVMELAYSEYSYRLRRLFHRITFYTVLFTLQ
jgi:hypothetical protein